MTRGPVENIGPTMGHDHGDGNDGGSSLSPGQVYTQSRNADAVVHKDGNGAVVADGPNLEIASAERLLPAIEAVITTLGSSHIHVSRGNYTVNDGDEITGINWPWPVRISFSPGATLSVNESISSTVGPNSRSVLIDVRNTGSQTAWIRIDANGADIRCKSNVDVPFYFADARQSRLLSAKIENPSVGGYVFGDEESSSTADFNQAGNNYIVGAGEFGGKFRSNTDAYSYNERVNAPVGVHYESTSRIYSESVFNAGAGTASAGDAVVKVTTDNSGASGWIIDPRAEKSELTVVRANGTSGSIEWLYTLGAYNQDSGDVNTIELAENGGSVGNTWHLLNAVDYAAGGKALVVTAGDPFYTDVWTVGRARSYSTVIDDGPNNSRVLLNGTDFTGSAPSADSYAPGQDVVDTSTGTVYKIVEDTSPTQLN
jgi:hypothetical protein